MIRPWDSIKKATFSDLDVCASGVLSLLNGPQTMVRPQLTTPTGNKPKVGSGHRFGNLKEDTVNRWSVRDR